MTKNPSVKRPNATVMVYHVKVLKSKMTTNKVMIMIDVDLTRYRLSYVTGNPLSPSTEST